MISYSALGTLGNLGNHLFQVASTIGIAEKLGTKAGFPAWKYEKYFKHPLPKFDNRLSINMPEKTFHYEESFIEFLKPDKNYNLLGYFQSEKYWNRETILKQFQFDDKFKETITSLYKQALSRPNVAISIRRGDFVNNPNYFQLPVTYYLNAYYGYFEGYTAIIFSDDINYCKTHFRALPNVHYADLNDIEQLCLMSLCKNHIISNSTFSWWGAYLADSNCVIRPEKNFAGELERMNDERDYWPEAWKVFNDYHLDLSDTTFVIPVCYDHNDRMQNLMLTIAFLNTHFKTNILIGEQGGNKFEHLKDYAGYTQFNYNDFHRTRMINELVKMAGTPVVVNWDADNICTPAQLYEAVNAIRNGYDIAYPFDGTVYRVPRFQFNRVVESLDVTDIDENNAGRKCSSVGHAIVMNKESFIKAGMENEKFISWTPEDSERFHRYNILGLKIKRIAGAIYHMDHFVGVNSSNKNPFFRQGEREFMKVATMKRHQLQEYIKTWEWAN